MPIDPSALYARGLISDGAMQGLTPVSGDFPPGKTPPSKFLDYERRPPDLMGGAPRQSASAAGKQTILPPSSPNVQAAINRLKAWLPENERNGDPNMVMRKNIQIMERGGSIAESMANHTLKIWEPHPNENGPALEGPVIDHE